MEEQVNLLVENEIVYGHATTGARFANYLIDLIAYLIMLVAIMIGLTITRTLVLREDDTFLSYVLTYATIIVYYTIMEGVTGGKTLGKYITGTRAVKEDGSRITFSDAFLRTLCRVVPFEPFSAFGGHPWHDRWTKTILIKERR